MNQESPAIMYSSYPPSCDRTGNAFGHEMLSQRAYPPRRRPQRARASTSDRQEMGSPTAALTFAPALACLLALKTTLVADRSARRQGLRKPSALSPQADAHAASSSDLRPSYQTPRQRDERGIRGFLPLSGNARPILRRTVPSLLAPQPDLRRDSCREDQPADLGVAIPDLASDVLLP